MEKIKLVVGDNFKDVNISAIKTIDKNNLEQENIIIVPDRFSLLMEKLVFKTLDISATFNISVMGISQLADLVFKKTNLDFEFVNKQESLLLIRKALINKKNELLCFKTKISNGLVEEIYNTISQFKSNQVNFENVKNSYQGDDNLLKTKLQDLAIIFEEYENLLNGKLDSTNILTQLETAVLQLDLKNYNFYYLNFDSFTKQGYSVMKNLIKTANNVSVGVVKPGIQNNAYIFENDVFEKLAFLAKDNNYILSVQTAENSLNKFQSAIHKNLFALNPQKNESNFLKVFETQNIKDEVEHIAKEIKNLLFNQKAKFQNIALACGDLAKYQNEIEKVFNEYNFKFFLDTSVNLTSTSIINFLINVLKIMLPNYSQDTLENFIISEYNELNKTQQGELLNFIGKYNIQSNIIFEELKNENINLIKEKIFKKIKILINIKNNCKNINNFINLINEIIKIYNLKEINLKLIDNFITNNQIKLEKIYLQIFDKLESVLNSLEKTIGDDEISYADFLDLFESVLKNQDLATVPISVDSIFVGDATTSFFEETNYLFVLGANENALPRYLSDCGIISDDVIDQISNKVELSPTVKMINRRNRFKIFNLLLCAEEKLFISYYISEADGKKSLASGFVKNLLEIFGEQNFEVVSDDLCLKNLYKDEKVFAENIAFYCGIKNKAKQELLKLANTNLPANFEVINSLYDILRSDFEKLDNFASNEIQNASELFFNNNRTKISQIEKYFSCPFKQFAVYGLKLKEKETAIISGLDIGNILHEVAEKFLSVQNNYVEKIKNNQENIEKIIKNILNNIDNYKLKLKINKIPLKVLEEESLRLCKYLYHTQTISKFKPAYLEVFFGGKDYKALEIKVRNKIFNLVGAVDRVDVFKDMFTVIDYKSGIAGKGNEAEVFYGDKIQIFVYMTALKNILNKKPCGVYYFPIKNVFEETDANGYMLKGKSVNNEKFLSAMDPSVNFENPSSQIFPCKISLSDKNIKNGEKIYNKSYVIDEKVLENMGDYAIKLTEKAIEEMLDGNIEPAPRADTCKSCPYVALCKFNGQKCRKNVFDIKKIFENKMEGGEATNE